MKEFKSIDEQIQLLKNREMIVEDGAYTILLRENYCSVINGYKRYRSSARNCVVTQRGIII